jgi:hypothetical protein
LERVDARTTATPAAPSIPTSAIGRTIRNYILWSYDRGSIHYDVMVTLILAFIFLAPIWINFKDKPTERNSHPTGVVVVLPDGQSGFIYQIEATAVSGATEPEMRQALIRTIEPIAGEVTISKYTPVRDSKGNVVAYKVWVQK